MRFLYLGLRQDVSIASAAGHLSRTFSVGTVLTLTTDRLMVDISTFRSFMGFMTGNTNLYTNQFPRAMAECKPWIAKQFPQLMKGDVNMDRLLERFDDQANKSFKSQLPDILAGFLSDVCIHFKLPTELPVYAMDPHRHLRIDPAEEYEAQTGRTSIVSISLQN